MLCPFLMVMVMLTVTETYHHYCLHLADTQWQATMAKNLISVHYYYLHIALTRSRLWVWFLPDVCLCWVTLRLQREVLSLRQTSVYRPLEKPVRKTMKSHWRSNHQSLEHSEKCCILIMTSVMIPTGLHENILQVCCFIHSSSILIHCLQTRFCN